MAKKVIKMLLTILMFLLIINIFEMNHTKSYAVLGDGPGLQFEKEIMHEEGAGSTPQTSWWDDIVTSAGNFLQSGKDAAGSGQVTTEEGTIITTPSDDDLQTIINDIYNILFPLGVGITVIIGGALGIKFMVASAEDKAKIKESLVPYVVGCIVIYGAFGIWKLAIIIFSAIGK